MTTEMPSLATWTSVYSTPSSLQSVSSSGSIEREASEMSVSPAQNFSKPPLVPAAPTVMFTSGLSWLNSSAAASANGCTVLEPSIEIEPERPLVPVVAAVAALVVVVTARGDAEGEDGAGANGEQPLLGHHLDESPSVSFDSVLQSCSLSREAMYAAVAHGN